MLKFCPECGEDLRGFAPAPRFCPGCGYLLPQDGFVGMGMGAFAGGTFADGTDASDDPEELLSFTVDNGGGMMRNAGTTFKGRRVGGKALITIRENGVAHADAPTFEADAGLLDRIAEIFARADVASWDGFSKSDPDVLDGMSFSFSATYGAGRRVNAHGYMMWPPRFGEVSSAVQELLMPLLDEYRAERG